MFIDVVLRFRVGMSSGEPLNSSFFPQAEREIKITAIKNNDNTLLMSMTSKNIF